ncbi:sugar-binding protein [Caballeronia sp. dw_19]|uniref:sugar-binding protein n=1 Tax=Caballeronia sp. dw_19 TaxID=2719791 RepID=UPI001BD44DB9|nr:sugar-binding protein [Caballeronia sp. dw_19]
MSRKWSIAALSAALLVSAVSTTAHAADKKHLYFVANGAVDFWKLAEAGMRKAQSELPNYTLEMKYPEQSSAAVQNRLLDDLVANGAAGIIISSVDPKTQTEELNKVAGQTLLATTDGDAPDTKRAFYLGSSNFDAGKQAAQILAKAMPNGGKCVAFAGLPGADLAVQRMKGMKEGLKNTKITIDSVRSDEMDQARAQSNAADILTARKDVNCMIGIFAYNTPQITLALQQSGRAGQVAVVGFDNDQGTLNGIKQGVVAGTVVQQPYQWGYLGMKYMARYVEGDRSFIPKDHMIIVPTQIIDKSNVDGFIEQVKTWMKK